MNQIFASMRLFYFMVVEFCIVLSARLTYGQLFEFVYFSERIEIDGNLDEWKNMPYASNFILNFPTQDSAAKWQTRVMAIYDQKYIYIAAFCRESAEKPVITSLKRDFDFLRNDAFGILIDPFHDGLNGFFFAVSAAGVQSEALVSDGRFLDMSWDNRWTAQVAKSDSGWTLEMAIPFSTLRYDSRRNSWKLNFIRNSLQHNERSCWSAVPLQFEVFSMAFCQEVPFNRGIPDVGKNFTLIPYAATRTSRDFADKTPPKNTLAFGLDAKVPVSPSLNLDLTLNPDFSNVEVDQQVTNLERFEIFFPERRQFFIENSDLFARFGFSKIRPFFSRRIGIGFDSVSKTFVQNQILFGARLSGKINSNLRTGILHLRTAQDEEAGILGRDFTVIALQQQTLGRSNIGMIFSQRQDVKTSADPYTRIIGLDYNLQSQDNKWWGKFFYHQAFKQKDTSDRYAHASFLSYRGKNLSFAWNHEYIGANYDINDIGFVRRKGQWRLEPSISWTHFTQSNKSINRHIFRIYNSTYADLSFRLTDHYSSVYYDVVFQNQASLSFGLVNEYVWLFDRGFDPSNTGGRPLDSASSYRFQSYETAFATAPRKLWRFGGNHRYGGYYNGKRMFWSGWATYRFQPYGSVNISLDYNQIAMPEGFTSAELWLVNTNFSLTFSRQLFLTTFLQYNTQSQNFNHNTRLQWRFRPVSDLFIVYSDNHDTLDWKTRNRALVIKLTYWLNLSTGARRKNIL